MGREPFPLEDSDWFKVVHMTQDKPIGALCQTLLKSPGTERLLPTGVANCQDEFLAVLELRDHPASASASGAEIKGVHHHRPAKSWDSVASLKLKIVNWRLLFYTHVLVRAQRSLYPPKALWEPGM